MERRPATDTLRERWTPTTRMRAKQCSSYRTVRRPRPLVASLYAPRLVRRRLESAWPEIVTGASVIILGLHGGSAIAALLLDGFAGRVLPVGLPSAMLLPALLALLVGGMRLIEMGAPAWRAEWRALSLAATAAGYILALT